MLLLSAFRLRTDVYSELLNYAKPSLTMILFVSQFLESFKKSLESLQKVFRKFLDSFTTPVKNIWILCDFFCSFFWSFFLVFSKVWGESFGVFCRGIWGGFRKALERKNVQNYIHITKANKKTKFFFTGVVESLRNS